MPDAMNCPVCRVPLVMSERQGVEIDYCPQCRGVWLDRGELDKIIERSTRETVGPAPAPPQPGYPSSAPGYAPDPYAHRDHYRHKRRKSWLEEIFD